MSIKDQLVALVEDAHDEYANPILPNDAVYLVRVKNLNAVCELIAEAASKTGKDVRTVIKDGIAPNLVAVKRAYPFIDGALDLIVKQYS
jgi:hypothetical protein